MKVEIRGRRAGRAAQAPLHVTGASTRKTHLGKGWYRIGLLNPDPTLPLLGPGDVTGRSPRR